MILKGHYMSCNQVTRDRKLRPLTCNYTWICNSNNKQQNVSISTTKLWKTTKTSQLKDSVSQTMFLLSLGSPVSSVRRPKRVVDVNVAQLGQRRPEAVRLFLGGLGLKVTEVTKVKEDDEDHKEERKKEGN